MGQDRDRPEALIERARLYYARALRDPETGPMWVPRIRALLRRADVTASKLVVSGVPEQTVNARLVALAGGELPMDSQPSIGDPQPRSR